MLEKRRVFDLTNTIMNYLFLVFLLLCALYFYSQWFTVKGEFIEFAVAVLNVFCLVVTVLSILMVAIAILLAVMDKYFRVRSLIWCLFRMTLCIVLSVFINAVVITVNGGLRISI